MDREISEDLAVHVDAGGFETFDEAAVGEAQWTGGGAETRNPQTAEVATACFAVTEGIGHRLADSVLGVTEVSGTEAAVALG